MGYIQSVVDTHHYTISLNWDYWMSSGSKGSAPFPGFCMASGVTVGQLVDIVRAHLAKYPETRHKNAAGIVSYAIGKAFPCSLDELNAAVEQHRRNFKPFTP